MCALQHAPSSPSPQPRMVVVHVITSLDIGGAERFLCRLATTMDRSRFRNIVFNLSPPGPLGKDLETSGIEVRNIGLSKRAPWSALKLLRMFFEIRALRPQIIQTWLYHSDLMGLILRLFAPKAALYWNIRCSEVDFDRYFFLTRWIVAILSRTSGIPTGVVHNSMAGRRSHEALGYHPRQWIYMPNGLELSSLNRSEAARASLRSEWGIREDQFVIGMVARFDVMKDYPTLVAAIRLILGKRPNLVFVMVGRGVTPQQPVFEGLPPNQVRILGERRDVPAVMSALDLFTLCSAFGEGFPNVVAEAMACGNSCVVTEVGDAAVIVGRTGFVCPIRDPEALAEGWERFLSLTADEQARLRQQARKTIEDHYSLPKIVSEYEALYANATRGS